MNSKIEDIFILKINNTGLFYSLCCVKFYLIKRSLTNYIFIQIIYVIPKTVRFHT